MSTTTRTRSRRRGQGATEYVLLVGLISILMVAAVRGLAATVGKAFEQTTGALEQVAADTQTASSEGTPSMETIGGAARLRDTRLPGEEGEGEGQGEDEGGPVVAKTTD